MTIDNLHPDDPAHIGGCAVCRAAVAGGLDVDLDRVWAAVAGEVIARPVGRVERFAGRLLHSPGLARAVVETPSLVLSWLLASAVVLAIGVIVTAASGGGTPWVALLAPALAGAGVAYAYGPGIDPAFELAQTMAVPDQLVLLARVLAVFGVNAVFGLAASLVAAPVAGLTLGWLLPMTTVAALGLAAATLARSANVGVAAGLAGWGLIVLGSAVDTRDLATAVERGWLAPFYLIGTIVFVGLALHATSGARDRGLGWQ
ncbi:MAG TPA: hypothetical protein VFV93_13900 [Thermomicrobiales bacterium]|nr:hypothetical protein [Thermomicrobiales bacterium]